MSNNKSNYATIYCSLHKMAAKKLKDLAKKRCKTESEVLRGMIEVYLKEIENKNLSYKHFKRLCPTGLKFIARTITREQDKRFAAVQEGRDISFVDRENS